MAAPTVTYIEKTVFGNKRLHVMSCTMGAASGNVETGLKNIDWFTVGIISAATASFISKKNLSSAGTAVPGTLNISAAVDGDVFTVQAFGK